MKKLTNKKGFTLAELLVVVAIIAVLVAVSIPVFNAQLEKSRDAVTVANLRSAYAEAQASYLTETASTPDVEVSLSDGKVTSVVVKKVAAKGTQAGGVSDSELPFDAKTLTAMDNTPGNYEVTFTYAADGKVTVTAVQK